MVTWKSVTSCLLKNDTATSTAVGEQLLVSAEEVSVLLSKTLSADSNKTVMSSVEEINNNIGLIYTILCIAQWVII